MPALYGRRDARRYRNFRVQRKVGFRMVRQLVPYEKSSICFRFRLTHLRFHGASR